MARLPSPTPEPVPFPWRPMIYGLIATVLFFDLLVFQGPIRRWIDRQVSGEPIVERAARLGYASTVNSLPIPCEEVERVAREHLARSGRRIEDLDPTARRNLLVAALERLKRRRMVARFSFYGGATADPEETTARIASLAESLPEGQEALQRRISRIGLDPVAFEREVAKLAAEESWIESEIAAALVIENAEIEAWYTAHQASLEIPERIEVSHLFLSKAAAPGQSPPDPEPRIREYHRRVQSGETSLGELARDHSNDARSKRQGGHLGWLSRHRIPGDFAESVFQAPLGRILEPFETKLGWHIALVHDKQPARIPELAEVRDEILAHLEMGRRQYAIDELLRQMGEKSKVLDFPTVFEDYLADLEVRVAQFRANEAEAVKAAAREILDSVREKTPEPVPTP